MEGEVEWFVVSQIREMSGLQHVKEVSHGLVNRKSSLSCALYFSAPDSVSWRRRRGVARRLAHAVRGCHPWRWCEASVTRASETVVSG